MSKVIAIISTYQRPTHLINALRSIFDQQRLPDRLLVVGECEEDFEQPRSDLGDGAMLARTEWLVNERTKGLSGSINSALMHLLDGGEDPEDTYIALLDDDDCWDPKYVEACLSEAEARGLDWVIAGLVRHEPDGRVIELSIPTELSPSLFFRGNPHVQGSNLFVRFSKILEAGLFDENLPSTTDRDLCIRLLDLGDCRYGPISAHLVHHNAGDHVRLSSPGSSKKRVGLERFLLKYRPRMCEQDLEAFLDRAKSVFGVDLTAANVDPPKTEKHSTNDSPITEGYGFQLIIGFTVTHNECARKLVGDILDLAKEITLAKVVVCDNSGDLEPLKKAVSAIASQGIEVVLKTAEEISMDSDDGLLGNYYLDEVNRHGIAFGRTALHHYLYLESYELANPVVWILDDDMRLEAPIICDEPAGGKLISALICGLIEDRVSVAVGGIYGDPPLPIASSVRVQLLELHSAIQSLLADNSSAPMSWEERHRNRLLDEYPDSHYDLTLAHFGHLEMPLHTHSDDADDLLFRVGRFSQGHDAFRPALPGRRPPSSVPTRGGNTIVLDVEVLRTYTNMAPVLNGICLRRGDTLWCTQLAYLGVEMMLTREKQVVSVPLFLRQERHDAFQVSPLLGDKLISDLWGGAFTRAFDSLMKEVASDPERRNPWGGLKFSDYEIGRFTCCFAAHLSHRLHAAVANAWRIRGLAKSIRCALRRDVSRDRLGVTLVASIERSLDWIEAEYSVDNEQRFSTSLMGYNTAEMVQFLKAMGGNRLSYSTRLPVRVGEREIHSITRALESMGIRGVRPLAQGGEGIIFSDGRMAYKYFYAGQVHFDKGTLDFLREALGPSKVPPRVVPLERVIEHDGDIVFLMPLIEGTNYSGGHLAEIIELLRGCRERGVAMKNLSPDNFRVGSKGLLFTDLGRDIKPYSDSLFREMCKRAYLCYRWHFRPDIKELMRRALRDESLPELYSLDHFLEAIEDDGYSQLEDSVSSIIELFQGKEVLDYGCREGTLSNAIARAGSRVRCYDVDMSRFRMIEHEDGVSVIAREELDSRIQASQPFGIVFCCRVLCTVDDREVDLILSDLRALVTENGRVVIGVCNPFNLEATWTLTHKKSALGKYNGSFTYGKTIKSTGRTRLEHHRSISWYEKRFLQAGLEVERIDESPGLDVERLSPGSEVLFFTLRPIRRPGSPEVSLLIKASSMEWRTIDVQVRHIVGQLEEPERFLEKVVVTDRWAGPFARQYDASDQEAFFKKLGGLIEEGTIDRVLVLDGDQSPGINRRWFGLDSQASRSANGQPVHIALHGFEECRGEYILQLDSDCLIARRSRSDAYLDRMVGLLKADERAVTVSMPIPYDEAREFTTEGERGRWRTEVRCCLLARHRLIAALPLGKWVSDGALSLPWHRALDGKMAELGLHSYRGGDPSTSFIHVPNDRKRDTNEWFNIMEAVEGGRIPQCQLNQVDLVGDMSSWLPTREEKLIYLLRGRNVPIPLLRRCLESLEHQSVKDWGLLIIDAGSDNGTAEFVEKVVSPRSPGRVTLLQNLEPLTPIENIDTAIRRLCSNPESVIVMVDSDDALIGTDAASIVMEAYAGGADLTVGTMLRADKHRKYPVDFANPRTSRGGNVWQHLRTFKKSLYDRVPADYLKLDGEWIRHTEDWAFMVPMVELSIKPVHINKSIYFYQPSPDKAGRSVADRERIIAGILEKASLREVGT